jgi:hypothetical protein
MKDQMTHERCSELLGPYARGELDNDQVADVESHLSTCDDCRRELSGLRALLDHQYEGLSGTELVRLERSIAAEMRADRDRTATVTPIEPRIESRRSLAGVALGAAATLLVVAFAIGSMMGGNSEDGSGDGAGTAAPQSEDAAGGGGDADGPRPVFVVGSDTQAFSEEAAGKFNSVTRALADTDDLTDDDLAQLGSGRLFRRFAAAYDSEDAAALQDRFVGELAQGAGRAAGDVTLCTRNTLEASTGPALPVLGGFARFEGRRALVLGFIYTGQTEGPLNRYSVWVYPQGACETPLRTAAGNVP